MGQPVWPNWLSRGLDRGDYPKIKSPSWERAPRAVVRAHVCSAARTYFQILLDGVWESRETVSRPSQSPKQQTTTLISSIWNIHIFFWVRATRLYVCGIKNFFIFFFFFWSGTEQRVWIAYACGYTYYACRRVGDLLCIEHTKYSVTEYVSRSL